MKPETLGRFAFPQFSPGFSWPLVWGFVSGLILAVCSWDRIQPILSLISLVPLCIGLARCPTCRAATCLSASFAVAWMLPAYHWLDVGCLPLVGSRLELWIPIRLGACAMVTGGAIVLWGLARRGWLYCGLLPMLLCITEEAFDDLARRLLWTTIDPLRLGLTQIDGGPFGQMAYIGGISLVTGLVASMNGLVADLLVRRNLGPRQRSLVIFCGLLLIGSAAISAQRSLSANDFDGSVCLVPQPFPPTRDVPGWLSNVGESSLIVFPEAALPCHLGVDASCEELVRHWQGQLRQTLVVGGLRTQFEPVVGQHVTALIADRHDGTLEYSDKRFPAPGLECTPPLLRWIGVESALDCQPGDRSPNFVLPGGAQFNVGICHDAQFPEWSQELSRRSADFGVHIANLGVTNSEIAKRQFRKCVQLRAIESGVPIVHCAMRGDSCFIDGVGRITATQRDGDRDAVLTAAVPRKRSPPIHSLRTGSILFVLAVSVLAWFCARS